MLNAAASFRLERVASLDSVDSMSRHSPHAALIPEKHNAGTALDRWRRSNHDVVAPLPFGAMDVGTMKHKEHGRNGVCSGFALQSDRSKDKKSGMSRAAAALLVINLILVLGLYGVGAAWLLGARLSYADRFVFSLQQSASEEVCSLISCGINANHSASHY